MVEKTAIEYREVISTCKALFEKKTRDYGTAWRILRLPSITDQIFIKAQRIRSIQEKKTQKVGDPVRDEFIGIINYCIIAMIQMQLSNSNNMDLRFEAIEGLYDNAVNETFELLQNKNHDYGEAWRDMRITSITDIIQFYQARKNKEPADKKSGHLVGNLSKNHKSFNLISAKTE